MNDQLSKIDHLAVIVKNIDQSVKYYTEKFNCEVKYQDSTWAMLKFNNISLAFTNGFLYDNERNVISKFNEANIPVKSFSSPEYISTLSLFNNNDMESLKELYTRFSMPIFCLISIIFSLIFSSYSSFFGREKTYFFLAILNIFYLLLTISASNTSVASSLSLTLGFFWMHFLFLGLSLMLMTKSAKRFFGYEGL